MSAFSSSGGTEREEVLDELLGSRSRTWLDDADLAANMNGATSDGDGGQAGSRRRPSAMAVITT